MCRKCVITERETNLYSVKLNSLSPSIKYFHIIFPFVFTSLPPKGLTSLENQKFLKWLRINLYTFFNGGNLVDALSFWSFFLKQLCIFYFFLFFLWCCCPFLFASFACMVWSDVNAYGESEIPPFEGKK